MIRSFTLRDIPLVHRLSEQGIVFHAESALTQDVRPLREALVNMLIGGQFPTYVWKDDHGDGVGFAQLRQDEDESHAHIICLGSKLVQDEVLDEAVWLPFLEQLVSEAGRQGIHSLIAEVSEVGDELMVLRKVGFAVYTRQDIWALYAEENGKNNVQFNQEAKQVEQRLVRATAVDEWDMHLLYANTVPRLIQLVEPIPPDYLQNVWLLREKGELAAIVHLTEGTAATWIRLYIHPNAQEQGEQLVRMALQLIAPKPNHPLYCCVRRYQSWVQNLLGHVGFQYVSSQALMVKHTVHHTHKHEPALQADMDAKAVAARRHTLVGPHEFEMFPTLKMKQQPQKDTQERESTSRRT